MASKFKTFLSSLCIVISSSYSLTALCQSDVSTIIFRDTIFEFAFDSLSNNLGEITTMNFNQKSRIVKHFKYLGSDTVFILKAWTTDPHYICDYPKTRLIPNQIYSFKVCFYHQSHGGSMNKSMGFIISNGQNILMRFKGRYVGLIK